jgi:hypothetical protein
MGGACSTYGGDLYRVLIGRPGGNTPLGIPKLRWKDNIKMNL